MHLKYDTHIIVQRVADAVHMVSLADSNSSVAMTMDFFTNVYLRTLVSEAVISYMDK